MTSPPIYHKCKNCHKENSFMDEPEEYKCYSCGRINIITYIGSMRFLSYIKKEKKE